MRNTLLPLFAVSGGLASQPANALELGDATVQSRLGQPLRASIAYALAPNEEISDSCVTLGLGTSANGLPGIGRAVLSVADGTILLTGKAPMREPMVAALVNVDCPYTANFSREYMMFVDPAGPAYDSQPNTIVGQPGAEVAAPAANNTPRTSAARAQVDQAPIGQSTRYRVQPGDTLSQIVQRIENRSASLWPTVNAIFDANPEAFIDNDPNKLKAGSWLTISSFVGTQPFVATADDTASPGADSVASAYAMTQTAATEATTTASVPADVPETNTASAMSDTSGDLTPASTAATSDNPFVDGQESAGETVVIGDTELEGPATVSASPNVTTAVVTTESQSTTYSSSWLVWLAGIGLGLIAALLLFGRLFRGRPGEPEAAATHPQRRATDGDSRIPQDDGGIEVVTHTDYTIEDDSPTAENLALDADLVLGTGLDAGTEMEVREDFGFATPTEIDVELPFEPQPAVPESDTGIFAMDDDETAVMEGSDTADEDEYDLSVVLDATKMPRPEDITQRDLQAVEVEPSDDGAETDSYMINTHVDLEILEQDYEDELTATQALNAEIMRAAEELATDSAESAGEDFEITSELTAATPLATVTELDVTAQLPSGSERASGDDETGIHEAATVEMPLADNDDDETGIREAATVEMPLAENDETAEMEIEGGKVDTKAR